MVGDYCEANKALVGEWSLSRSSNIMFGSSILLNTKNNTCKNSEISVSKVSVLFNFNYIIAQAIAFCRKSRDLGDVILTV